MDLYAAAKTACDKVGSSLYVASGWQQRGHGRSSFRSIMAHDTITPASWSRRQLTRLLVNGYARLPGPIANVQSERNGDAVLIAAGRAYHAGPGFWPGISSGNLNFCGVETANNGRPERWTEEQYWWMVAFCQAAGLPILPVGHKEWAPSRKQDPWSVDMPTLRGHVANITNTVEEVDPMADYAAELSAIAKNTQDTARQTAATVRQVDEVGVKVDELSDRVLSVSASQARLLEALVEQTVASFRKGVDLAPDAASDRIWSTRVTSGRANLEDAKRALQGLADRTR